MIRFSRNFIFNQKGQIFVLAIVVLFLVMTNTLLIASKSLNFSRSAKYSLQEIQAFNLAEAGADKAVASLNSLGDAYNGEGEVSLGIGTYEVSITTKDSGTRIIQSTGFIPNKANSKVKRTIQIVATKGIGVSFVYGVQVGEGGLELGNSNRVIGSVYSNGNIIGNNSNEVTGDVYVAGGPQPSPDQGSECVDGNCSDFIFGKDVGGENRLDVAQSFRPSISAPLNKVSIRVQKIGNPVDVSVRVMADDSGKPDKNQVLALGTLYSSLVTSNYGWIDVAFNSSPDLSEGTTYWLVIDTSSNSSNYWSWQNDSMQGYTRGVPKWSPNWQTGNPTWNTVSGDFGFKLYLGGSPTSLRGGNNFDVGGSVHANTIDNIDIEKDAYFQLISNSSVDGVSYPGSADPPPKVFPISEANISAWKEQAQTAGVTTGDINTCLATLGPGKIIGNVIFDNSCNVTVKSPVWITGNFTANNTNTLTLSPEFGSSSGVVIVDGITNLGNGNRFLGTGTGSSMLMLLSTYDSRTDAVSAIKVNNSGNTAVLYANNGIIEPGNSNSFKELTAWKIRLMNSTTITYETGLSSTLFSSGPSGSYTLVKGTYQVK